MYLIIGASSFIGSHLYNYCVKSNINTLGTYYQHSHSSEWVYFDINKNHLRDLVNRYLQNEKLDAVIICGANTSIDQCKSNELESNLLNVINTQRIITEAKTLNAKVVFLSSESVFDGNKGFFTEDDIPNPLTLYGRQKLQVEKFMMETLNNYLILRVSRAVGSCFGENDIFNEFYNKIINNKVIYCLKNQRFCLTEVDDIAKGIIGAIHENLNGIYHLSSNNYISRYELAKLFTKKIFGGYEKIEEKEYREMSFLDNRQVLGGLMGKKLMQLLKLEFLDTENILEKYKNSYDNFMKH